MRDSDKLQLDRRKFLAGTAATGIAGLAGCASGPDGQDETDGGQSGDSDSGDQGGDSDSGDQSGDSGSVTWEIGTPGEGSLNFVAAQGFARVLDEGGSSVDLSVGSYSGNEEAIRLVGRGDNAMATGPNILGAAAFNSSNPVEGINFSGDRAVQSAPYQTFSFANLRSHWVTLDDSIETVEDLRGKRVSVATVGSQFIFLAQLSIAGVLEDVEPVNNDWSDIPFALNEGRVDVALGYTFSETVTPGWHQDMAGYEGINLVPYTDSQLQNFEESPLMRLAPVPANELYEADIGVDEVQAPTSDYALWLGQDTSEDAAYDFVETIFDNPEQVQEFHGALGEFDPESAVSGLASDIPVHPGVAQYYQDNDLWRDGLTSG